MRRLAAFFGVDVGFFMDDHEEPGEAPQVRGPAERIYRLLQRAEADREGLVDQELVESWQFVRESGPARLAGDIALRASRYLITKERYAEAEQMLRDLTRRWLARLPVAYEIRALTRRAAAAFAQTRYFEAVEWMETCLPLLEEVRDDTALAKDIWYNLGIYYLQVGRPGDSVRAYTKALELHDPNDSAEVAFVHMGLGQAYKHANQLELSLQHSAVALEMLTELGDSQWAGYVCNNMGDALAQLGRWSEAKARYEAGLLAHRIANVPKGCARNTAGIAQCQLELGDAKKALATVNQAIAQLEALGELPDRADTLLVRARIHLALSNWKKARADLEEAKTFFYERRMVAHLMRAVAVQAELDARMGALEQGAQNLRESAEVFRVLANHLRTVERAA